jgi:ABC-2 type transport system permease protein
MNDVLLLLRPRWLKFRNQLKGSRKEKFRYPFFLALIIALWLAIFFAFYKALKYFTAEEMFGTIAAMKLLSMIVVTFAFVLIISNIIATFSAFFLSEDLELIMAGPMPPRLLYAARFVETLTDSSWMVLVFGFPVFMAYGAVFSAPVSFYGLSLLSIICLLMLTTAFSIIVVESLVRIFPVRRLRDLFVLVAILMFIGVYLLFRMIRPEEFLNPEGFATVMDYMSVMSETSSPLLPTTWITEILRPYITGYGHDDILFYTAVLVLAAFGAYRLAGHNHQAYYFAGYSKAMESKGARLSTSRLLKIYMLLMDKILDRAGARIVIKETLLMARDWGRISQLLLLGALIVVYLYNFSVLPSLDNPVASMFLKNTVAFLNIGLAGFVLASLGVRFLFPTVSAEGRAFWILKSSPVSLRRILWIKFLFYLVPMLTLGLILVIMTNRLLDLEPFMFTISTITVLLLTVGITSLSVGMGVVHADFKEADPNRAFAGFGGLMTMIYAGLAVAGVVISEVFPVYRIVTYEIFNRPLRVIDFVMFGICFGIALALALLLIIRPMQMGLRRIEELEI